MAAMNLQSPWPKLPAPSEWEDTLDTLHLWTQIVGKVRLEHMPWINHSWNVTLYVSSHGLTTSFIPHPSGGFEMEFNFLDNRFEIRTVRDGKRSFPLEPMTVADFYSEVIEGLQQLGIPTRIYTRPVEIPDPIVPFPEDTEHSSYEAEPVGRFWEALTHVNRVFTRFRSAFMGKVSPVHFFWGSFDLAVTRFSGAAAPKHPGGVPNCPDWIMEEAYSRELCSAGFWPGTGLGEAAFYAYAYPEPEGFRRASIKPVAASFNEELGEFILPYEAVRTAANPDEALLGFLESTYESAATLGSWDPKNVTTTGATESPSVRPRT